MNVIYGEIDHPEKTGFIIARGIDECSLREFLEFKESYPQYGIVLCLGEGQVFSDVTSISPKNLSDYNDKIHQILYMYSVFTDADLIGEVRRIFGSYDDENDPEILSPPERDRMSSFLGGRVSVTVAEPPEKVMVDATLMVNKELLEECVKHSALSEIVDVRTSEGTLISVTKNFIYDVRKRVLEGIMLDDSLWEMCAEEDPYSFSIRLSSRLCVSRLCK